MRKAAFAGVICTTIAAVFLACGYSSHAANQGIHQEQVRFRNGSITLAGTLFLPNGKKSHPAVVIFHGSGPQPRNAFIGRWFAGQGSGLSDLRQARRR